MAEPTYKERLERLREAVEIKDEVALVRRDIDQLVEQLQRRAQELEDALRAARSFLIGTQRTPVQIMEKIDSALGQVDG